LPSRFIGTRRDCPAISAGTWQRSRRNVRPARRIR
jgi:hypothetical protein